MDRSFLSDPAVIATSRRFVCVRLATYESAEEAKVLRSIFLGRSGELENTVFAILAPDGATQLVRPGRSPEWAYRDAADMSRGMERIADRYDSRRTGGELPTLATVRLALNVAACDRLPLVVVHSKTQADVIRDAKPLVKLAWGSLIGRAVFATAHETKALRVLSGDTRPGILVVSPGAYGTTGRVLARIDADDPTLERALTRALDQHRAPQVDSIRRHIQAGRSKGVNWKTKIPVTDPGPRGRRR